MQALLGQKKSQTQKFREDGTRIPVTVLSVSGNVVTQVKQTEKDGYTAVQIGFGTRKHGTKALAGHLKKAGVESMPRMLREVRITDDVILPELGALLQISEILKPGDTINVTGQTKGKGFAGAVKRHHFRGGPRTHGQSDRERAPGSIGQTTTPGRVYRGKRMAGHMGDVQATVTNLEVVDVNPKTGEILIKGLVPGPVNSIVFIEKTGEAKKFVPLLGAYKEEVEEVAVEETQETQVEETVSEVKAEEKQAETASETETEEAPAVEEAVTEKPEETVAEEAVSSENNEAAVEEKPEEVKEEKGV